MLLRGRAGCCLAGGAAVGLPRPGAGGGRGAQRWRGGGGRGRGRGLSFAPALSLRGAARFRGAGANGGTRGGGGRCGFAGPRGRDGERTGRAVGRARERRSDGATERGSEGAREGARESERARDSKGKRGRWRDVAGRRAPPPDHARAALLHARRRQPRSDRRRLRPGPAPGPAADQRLLCQAALPPCSAPPPAPPFCPGAAGPAPAQGGLGVGV